MAAVAVAGALAQSQPPAANPTAATPEAILAAQRACEARHPPRKSKGTISESSYRHLERVFDKITKNNYAEAEKDLREMMADANGDYEKAVLMQTLGFVLASDKREGEAVKLFQQAVALGSLPQVQHEQMIYNIAQIQISMNNYDQGLKTMEQYMSESCNPLPDAHILMASVQAERKDWNGALRQVDLALAKAKAPKESWLQLKLALHYELKQLPKCAETLLQLVALVPSKKDYWKQLNGMLFELKKDPEALAVLALADRKGFLENENEYRNLANLYAYMQIPYKAAQVLQRGLDAKVLPADEKTLEMLANCWYLAREYNKSEEAMRKAAAASDKGELWFKLGNIYAQQEKWKPALEALTQAQKKGGVKEPDELVLLTGIAATNVKEWKRAEEALKAAQGHEKTTKAATEWLNMEQQLYAQAHPEEGKPPAEGEAAQDKEAPQKPEPPPEKPAQPPPPKKK